VPVLLRRKPTDRISISTRYISGKIKQISLDATLLANKRMSMKDRFWAMVRNTSSNPDSDELLLSGVNSIQCVFDGDQWWVAQLLWNHHV
jgi:hypothetical protein